MELLEKRFQHSNVQAAMIAPIEVDVDKEFNIRLDIVNIGKKPGRLVRVEELILPEFKTNTFTDNCNLTRWIHFIERRKFLDLFRLNHLNFSLQATKTGVYQISPQSGLH